MFALLQSFKNYPEATIDESPLLSFTYKSFYGEIELATAALGELALPKNSIVVIYGIKSQLRAMILLFGSIKAGLIPFVVENGAMDKIKDLEFASLLTEQSNTDVYEGFHRSDFLKSYAIHCKVSSTLFIGDENSLVIVSSSGTTAKIPKKILLGKDETMQNIKSNVEALQLTATEKTLIVLPVSYSYGLIAQFFSHLYVGANIVFATKNIGILQIPFLLNKHDITNIYLTPLLARLVAYYNLKCRPRTNKLNFITIGGDKPYASIIKKMVNLFDCNIYTTYGLAEAGPRVATKSFAKEEKKHTITIGTPNPNVEVEIKNTAEYDKIFNDKSIGVVHINSPSVYLGYIKGNKIQKPLSATLVKTNDLGMRLENGEIMLLGRADQYFVSNGQPIWFYDLNEEIYESENVIKVNIQKKTGLSIEVFYRGQLEENNIRHTLQNKYGITDKKDYNIHFIKYDGNQYYK